MTAPTFSAADLGLILPYRAYTRRHPIDPAEAMEAFIEGVIYEWTEKDQPVLLDALAIWYGHDRARVDELVTEVCRTSYAAAELQNRPGVWEKFDAAKDDYLRALAAIATKPVVTS